MRTYFMMLLVAAVGLSSLACSQTPNETFRDARAAALVEQWFAKVQAPVKKIVWFEDSAHMVYEEELGKTLVSLVNEVLPLTRTPRK